MNYNLQIIHQQSTVRLWSEKKEYVLVSTVIKPMMLMLFIYSSFAPHGA